jgi:mannose-6-phosphate isomerase-like protein (cupin superfamily)
MRTLLVLVTVLGMTLPLLAAERTIDPTFLHRYVPDLREQRSDITTATCHYKPIFGAGDSQAKVPHGIARFGEITVDAGGDCQPVTYPAEEQAWVILDGSGTIDYAGEKLAVRKHDFLYVSPSIRHSISTSSGARIIVMGFNLGSALIPAAVKPAVANFDEVKWQTVSGHPDSVLYQLLMGGESSTRDKIAAGHVLTSLFIMEFEPGGTNFPHHHQMEEEIYLVLDGSGDMVADGGMDGVEGRHPARAGDAYFFRLNCTVGFYASKGPGPKARILAVRSRYPFSKEVD